MEQEKENQEKGVTTSNANVVQDELTEYRVYEHPLLPKRIVKIGFCWPAFIVGPAYLLYRKLWVWTAVWIVTMWIVQYGAISNFQDCGTYGCRIPADNQTALEAINAGITFIALIIPGYFTNDLWKDDLIKRGYVMTKFLRARSMDDARAIIEREKILTKKKLIANAQIYEL
ncbi:MAG TPA: DUF2628 domain-containing protein [Gallionella sp.]|nr:DUF2628 domain-containing protein [Gallionella sp.]